MIAHAFKRMGWLVAMTTVALLLSFVPMARSAHAATADLLFYGPSVPEGASSQEAQQATALGLTYDIVDGPTWDSMTTAQFAAYKGLVVGDPRCATDESYLAAAGANSATWAAALNGNVSVVGTDPSYHSAFGTPGAQTMIKDMLNFAAGTPGKTGAYLAIGCSDAFSSPNTPVSWLSGLGSFTDQGGSGDASHIVASSPALLGLSDADIANWSQSTHEEFNSWPSTGSGAFAVLAIQEQFPTGYTATDGTVGGPYILARGPSVTVISNIQLTPPTQSHNTLQTATLTATVTENSVPVGGAVVTLKIIAGPNAGTTLTGTTGPSGVVTFTYTSSLTGQDTAVASYTDSTGHLQTSGNALVNWFKDTTAPTCTLKTVTTDPITGHKMIVVAMQDGNSGLGSIKVAQLSNATLSPYETSPPDTVGQLLVGIPVGSTAELDENATKSNTSLGSQVGYTVTDQVGNSTTCDPVMTSALRSTGAPSSDAVAGIGSADHLVHVYNDQKGIESLTVTVNGHAFALHGLSSGQKATLEIGSALQSSNTVSVTTTGQPGGSATLLFGNI